MKNKVKQKRQDKISWLDALIALTLGTIIIGGILVAAQSIGSGYHFLDDHELLRMEYGAKNGTGLFAAIKAWIASDIHQRFRPLYWIERVTACYLLGSNFTAWNIWLVIKGVLTFALLYGTARYLKFGRVISAIFPMIIMVGTQFTPWYRCGNQESTGLLLCAGAMCLIAAQSYSGKYKSKAYNIAIVLLVILSGLIKESFTLFMLLFPALKIWLEYWDGCGELQNNKDRKTRLFSVIRENWWVYALILLATLINVYMITFRVGVDKISYAGFHEDTAVVEYIEGIGESLFQNMKWYTVAALVWVFMMVLCYQLVEKQNIRKYVSLCLILLCAMGIQLVAHAKSGMWGRYMFPYMVAYALVFILLGYRIFGKDRLRGTIYLIIAVLLLGQSGITAARQARDYAKDGNWMGEYFQCILDNTSEDDRIVSAFVDGELDLATECWLETHGRTQVYSNIDGEWSNTVQMNGELRGDCSWDDAKIVTFYSFAENYTLTLMGDAAWTDYDVYKFGNYAVMVKR